MVTPLPTMNPLAGIQGWVDPRRQALLGLASGLVSGNDWGQGLGRGFAMAAEGRKADDAYATAKKEEAERAKQLNYTIQAFQKAGRQDLVDMANAGMMGEAWRQYSAGSNVAEAPASIREWNAFSSMTPEQQQQYLIMKRAAPFLDTGPEFVRPDPLTGQVGPTAPTVLKSGDIPTGFQQTAPGEIAPMPGSEQDRERQAGKVKAESAINVLEEKNRIAIDAIDSAIDQANWATTGNVMGNSGWVPIAGQGALDLGKTLDTIKANIGFEELQTMRDNSPTGGALGQVTERELAFLQSTIANIEQSQSEDQLKANLKILRDFLASSKEQRKAAYQQQYGGGSAPSAPAAGGMDDVDAILRDLGL